MWHQIIPIIENNHSFIITSHIKPDCDALGSELALAEHLRNLSKNVTIINSDAIPTPFRFLDRKRRTKRYSPKKHGPIIKKADVIIVLDASGGWQRVGPVGKALEEAQAIKICIDHHPDSSDFVDVAAIDTDASAAAELIYDLIRAMNGTVSKSMAEALYAAILTDTGSFRFPKTNPQTHHITADLLVAGADPFAIYSQIYEQYSTGCVRLKGQLMESIQTAAQGQIAYYGLTRHDLQRYGVKGSELDGFANLGQQIGGVCVTIFCMEAAKKRVKISLRSNGTIAINQIAVEYGGGGHPSAAGALVDGELNKIMTELVKKTEALFETNGPN